MILMPHIFDVRANENARYKRNELELLFYAISDWRKLVPVYHTLDPMRAIHNNFSIGHFKGSEVFRY